MTQAVLSLAFAAAYFLCAIGLGRLIGRDRSIILSFGIGQAVLILLFMLGGILHLLSRAFFLTAISAPLVLCLFLARKGVPGTAREMAGAAAGFLKLFSPLEKIIGILLLAPPFLGCFVPVIGDQEHDTLRYHWSVILQFFHSGGIVFCPEILQGNGPLSLEMSFLPYLALGLENGARLHGWLLFVLLGLSSLHLAKGTLGPGASLVPLLVWGTPLLSRFCNNGFIDVGLSFYGVCTVLLFRQWLSAPAAGRSTVLLGLAAGTMLGAKYTAIFFLAGLLVYAFYAVAFHQTGRTAVSLALAALTAAAAGGFWYVRNAINLHNPVFPACFNLFPTLIYPREQLQAMHAWLADRSVPFGRGPLALLCFPWNFTMHADRFQNWMSITPVYLAALPLLLRRAAHHFRAYSIETTVLLTFFLCVFLTFHEARYFSPVMPLAALVCLGAFSRASGARGGRPGVFWYHFILLNIAFSAVLIGRETWKSGPFLFKSVREISPEKQPPFFSGYAALNSRIKADEKALLIFGGGLHGSVHYYVKARSVLLQEYNPAIIGLEKSDEAALGRYLDENGFDYVLDMNPARKAALVPPGAVKLESAKGAHGWALYSTRSP